MIFALKPHVENTKAGFTLVELAIVMAIIGLLTGGVLKGQEMYNNAKITRFVSDVNTHNAAVNTFLGQYGALPGDMPNPDSRLPDCAGCAAVGGRLGDGLIDDGALWRYGTAINLQSEPTRAWLHLAKANMITGVDNTALGGGVPAMGQTHPISVFGSGYYIETIGGSCASGDAHQNAWGNRQFSICQPAGLMITVRRDLTLGEPFYHPSGYGAMRSDIAMKIDIKIDDGKPLSGVVRAAGHYAHWPGCANPETREYMTPGGQDCTVGVIIR